MEDRPLYFYMVCCQTKLEFGQKRAAFRAVRSWQRSNSAPVKSDILCRRPRDPRAASDPQAVRSPPRCEAVSKIPIMVEGPEEDASICVD